MIVPLRPRLSKDLADFDGGARSVLKAPRFTRGNHFAPLIAVVGQQRCAETMEWGADPNYVGSLISQMLVKK